jgi:dihydrofolate synthase / folylpolyglutamate synthase
MYISAIETARITPGAITLTELLDTAVTAMPPGSILAVTSKVVSLCESSVASELADKNSLIREEADYFVPGVHGRHGIIFTIRRSMLIPNSGIDESNSEHGYILWPRDPQGTANKVRAYLVHRFGHDRIGVVITDSTCSPLRRGASGIAIAFSGFKPLRDYVGKADLFGRPFAVSQADLAGGLAASAVLVMGEGAESTPLAIIQEVDFIEFVPRDPTADELAWLQIPIEDDLYAPFLKAVIWQAGGPPGK